MSHQRRPALAALAALVSLTALTPTFASAATSGAGVTSSGVTAGARTSDGSSGDGTEPPGSSDRGQTSVTVDPLVGQRTQPNIVVIMADDMRDDDVQYMPNVQRLIADQGVRFVNSFSPQPLCCPARASFDTGQYTHNHGVWSHVSPYGFQALHDQNTLPVWLQRAGYDTVFLGKYLNGYGVQPLRDGSPSVRYVPPGWTDWRGSVDGGMEPGSAVSGGTYHYFNTTLNVNGVLQPHRGEYQTWMLGKQVDDIIRDNARSTKPLFLWASFVAPHHGLPRDKDDPGTIHLRDGTPFRIKTPARPRSVWGKFDDVIKRPPGWRGEADVSDKPFFVRSKPVLTRQQLHQVLIDTRQRAEALSILDEEVAHTVDVLRETGQLDNTYLVFTSDNGYFQGEHRMPQGKILPYEPSLRVPTLIRGPGIPAGQTRTDPFLTIDFAPTFLDLAGAPPESAVDGVSMAGVAEHGDQGWTRGVLTETGPRRVGSDPGESDNFLVTKTDGKGFLHRPYGPSPLRFSQGLRTPRYLYVEHASREKELYDLSKDEAELTNLVDRPSEARVVAALARELDLLRTCKGAECARPMPRFLQAREAAPWGAR